MSNAIMTISCPRIVLSLFISPAFPVCSPPTTTLLQQFLPFSFLYPLGPTGHPAPSALIPDLGLSPQGLSVPGRLLYWQLGPSGAHLLRSPHPLCLLSSHQLRVSAHHTHPSRLPPGLLPRLSALAQRGSALFEMAARKPLQESKRDAINASA